MKTPSQQYRDYLRGVRVFLEPQHMPMLMGELINNLRVADLEVLFELVIEATPAKPVGYRPHH